MHFMNNSEWVMLTSKLRKIDCFLAQQNLVVDLYFTAIPQKITGISEVRGFYFMLCTYTLCNELRQCWLIGGPWDEYGSRNPIERQTDIQILTPKA